MKWKPVLFRPERNHFSPKAEAMLSQEFHIESIPWGDADVAWVRLESVDAEKLRRQPRLKLVATNCTGTDHIDLEECKRRGIEVLSLQGMDLTDVHATAEHTVSLMLQALRHRCDRTSGRIGRELRGSNVGVLGEGRIGRQVFNLCGKFRADCGWVSCGIPPLHFYDIVTLHVPLNDETRGMVNAEFLSKLKPNAIVVNTARDAIVHKPSLVQWIHANPDAMYVHDFKDDWPLSAFSRINEQVISTPHIGGWTIESLHKTEELLAEKVIAWEAARRVTC